MSEDCFDLMEVPDIAKNALGGTEIMMRGLYDGRLPRELLQEFQIVPGRMGDLRRDKVRILYCHDLPNDPSNQHLSNGGWDRFHRIVFVSNWQMQQFIQTFEIPWSKCVVLHNAINPIDVEVDKKPRDKIRLIYHTTPHRGLNILYSVFDKLCETHDDIELDVYSSFKLYGWPERDEPFADLFKALEDHPKINYHGAVPNNEIREAVAKAHIFAYPSIWPETFCLCLAEAMSGGLLCVHPNYACLAETAANWTMIYQWHEEINNHAALCYSALESSINVMRNDLETTPIRLANQKSYADLFYGWDMRTRQWQALLTSLLNEPRELKEQPNGPVFFLDTSRM